MKSLRGIAIGQSLAAGNGKQQALAFHDETGDYRAGQFIVP
jgi:hypothetical protein